MNTQKSNYPGRRYILSALLFLLVSGTGLFAEVGNLETVGANRFFELIEEKRDQGEGVVLDVRTPGEFEAGNAPGSLNIDFYNPGFRTQLDELDKSEPYFIYCQSGNRSGKTLRMMKNMGFIEVYELSGGWSRNASRLSALENE